MSNTRVYTLAKELGLESKEFVKELEKEGIKVKSHMSTVDDETAELIMTLFKVEERSPNKEETSIVKEETAVVKEEVKVKEETTENVEAEKELVSTDGDIEIVEEDSIEEVKKIPKVPSVSSPVNKSK